MSFKDLFRPKWKHSNPQLRHDAVAKLADPVLLAEIAKTDSSSGVRWAAVERLTDQAVLAGVVKKDIDWLVRLTAVQKLTDQSLLADVAKTDSYASVRIGAVNKLKDQAVLADVAKTDSDASVRIGAVNKLKDQAVLAEIAKTDSDANTRMSAVSKLRDQAVLAEIAQTDGASGVRKAAVEKLTDQTMLGYIAKTESDGDVLYTAVDKLTDENVLAELAADNKAARYHALEKLTEVLESKVSTSNVLVERLSRALLQSSDDQEASCAVDLLSKIGTPNTAQALALGLSKWKRDEKVAIEICEAIATIGAAGGTHLLDAIREALSAEDFWGASRMAAHVGPVLEHLLGSPTPGPAEAASVLALEILLELLRYEVQGFSKNKEHSLIRLPDTMRAHAQALRDGFLRSDRARFGKWFPWIIAGGASKHANRPEQWYQLDLLAVIGEISGQMDPALYQTVMEMTRKVEEAWRSEDTSHGGMTVGQEYGAWVRAAGNFMRAYETRRLALLPDSN